MQLTPKFDGFNAIERRECQLDCRFRMPDKDWDIIHFEKGEFRLGLIFKCVVLRGYSMRNLEGLYRLKMRRLYPENLMPYSAGYSRRIKNRRKI